MKKIIICIACVLGVLCAEPENSADASITQESPAPSMPRAQDSIPTPSNGSNMPYDDFAAIMQNANASLNSAMAFAKMGDYNKALELFTQACRGGNAAGCFGSGLIYMYGMTTGVPEPDVAVKFYAQAWSGGDATAGANLALGYDNGEGVEQGKAQAHELYAISCAGGDALACTNLGWMYANGVGTNKDYAKAMESYRAACTLGNELGCYNLGLMTNTYNIYGVTKGKMGIVEMNYVACEQGANVACGHLWYLKATGEEEADHS